VRPKHGSPDITREIAFKKIASRIKGTAMASEKLGMAQKFGFILDSLRTHWNRYGAGSSVLPDFKANEEMCRG
jgi:hypothetical protein